MGDVGEKFLKSFSTGITAFAKNRRVTMGIMIGKAVKLAEGNVDIHSRNILMNKDFIAFIFKRM